MHCVHIHLSIKKLFSVCIHENVFVLSKKIIVTIYDQNVAGLHFKAIPYYYGANTPTLILFIQITPRSDRYSLRLALDSSAFHFLFK